MFRRSLLSRAAAPRFELSSKQKSTMYPHEVAFIKKGAGTFGFFLLFMSTLTYATGSDSTLPLFKVMYSPFATYTAQTKL